MAARLSQRFVEKRINLPNAAQFQGVYAAKIEDLGDGVYAVISYVDAPSQSAVALRVRYFCKLKKASD